MSEFELVALRSGTFSLRSTERKETFHPGIGPVREAKILHVDQQNLRERCDRAQEFVIWDVGFGAAANALSAVEALGTSTARVEIHSFDKTLSPIRFALEHADSLQYFGENKKIVEELLAKKYAQCGLNIHWFLHEGDFREEMLKDHPAPDAIFYDPYSPIGNQEMWTLQHFTQMRKLLTRPCLFTNYTRSTAVRVTLLMAGFYVGIGDVIGEKAETTVASNELSLLKNPLSPQWLERVRISRNGSPMKADNYSIMPIEAADLKVVESHPQFSSLFQLQ